MQTSGQRAIQDFKHFFKPNLITIMKQAMYVFFIAVLLGFHSLHAQSNPDAIVGEWVNEAGDAKFKIYKASNSKYYGKVIWGTGGESKDVNNPDPKLRSREVVGLVILNNFTFEGKDKWGSGTIYDPKNGKTYSCMLTLKSGNKLDVRGYVGVSLFGRTETWTKIN